MSASGAIKYMRPGHRHKRFVKSPKRNAGLRKGQMLHEVNTRSPPSSVPSCRAAFDAIITLRNCCLVG